MRKPLEFKSHDLKCKIPYFEKIRSGAKTQETRLNDRDFHVFDLLILHEWDGENYTGRREMVVVTDILTCEEFEDTLYNRIVVMSVKRIASQNIGTEPTE